MTVTNERGLKENCKAEVGKLVPVIDRNCCEGKKDCVEVCPYSVFEVRKLTPEEKKKLKFISRLKVSAHGNIQAFAVNAPDCHACGLCVQACPEKAIKLISAERA